MEKTGKRGYVELLGRVLGQSNQVQETIAEISHEVV